MAKLTQEQMEKRRRITKIIYSIFGIIFLLMLIGLLFGPPDENKSPHRSAGQEAHKRESIQMILRSLNFNKLYEGDASWRYRTENAEGETTDGVIVQFGEDANGLTHIQLTFYELGSDAKRQQMNSVASNLLDKVFNKQRADKMLAHKIGAEKDKSRPATAPKGFKFAWNGKLMKGSISATYIAFGVSDTYAWTPELNDL